MSKQPTKMATQDPKKHLALVGVHSRSYSKQYWVRSTVLKEALAGVRTLQIFENWARATPSTVWFTDCISLSYLSCLKGASSKMATYSMYISSYSNLSIFHSRGSLMLVTFVDLLTRSSLFKMISANTVPEPHLEKLALTNTKTIKIPKL